MLEVNATGMLIVSQSVQWEYTILSAHFYGNVQHIGVGRHSIRSPTRFSQDLRSGQVDVEAHVFYYVINHVFSKIALLGF